MKPIEILAPAGGMESLVAGVRCGADAVYLGGKAFNARQNAGNFDHAALQAAIDYCHLRGVKVYITVNTLLTDRELEPALRWVGRCLQMGADAFILQDLGLIYLVHKQFPQATLHASTQMSVMSPDGFCVLREMGFARAVVPREMSEKEVAALQRAASIELEAFVHGALCMCVSGQCYLSAMLGSRSGNRGLCAQPCRLPFYVEQKGNHDLSLKDLSLVQEIDRMAQAGIVSLKIEGRMKRPEYVAAAVTACEEARRRALRPERLQLLESVFSRSGFTQGYWTGRLGKQMFGIRQKEDVQRADAVRKEIEQLYQKERPAVAVDFSLVLHSDKPAALTAAARGRSVTVYAQQMATTAQNKPLTEEMLRQRLSKCGGTPFYAQRITVDLEPGLQLPAAEVNGLRRGALEQLTAALLQRQEELPAAVSLPPLPERRENDAPLRWRGVFDAYEQVPENSGFLSLLFLPLRESAAHFAQACGRFPGKVGVALPRGLFGQEAQIKEKLKQLYALGVRHALAGNLGVFQTAKNMGFLVHGDFGLNVMNRYALYQLEQLGIKSQILSIELKGEQMKAVRGTAETGAILYGRLPLMLTRNCPVRLEKSCRECGRNSVLTDRKGMQFPVRCDYGCSELLNAHVLYLLDRSKEAAVDFGQLLFTTETKEQAAAVIAAAQTGSAPQGAYTRGLFYRGVE